MLHLRARVERLSPDVLAALATAGLLFSALGPWLGEVAAFRNWNMVVAGLGCLALWAAPARMAQPLSRVALGVLLAAALLHMELVAASHLWSFHVNGVDFSIFDWMLESTLRGRVGYSPIYDVNHFGVHSTFLLLAAVPLHAVFRTPWLLMLLGPLVVWLGVFAVLRLESALRGRRHGLLTLALVLATLCNAWVDRVVNAGFRIEGLIPPLSLWFLCGWVERRPRVWVVAALGLLCAKEDTALFLVSFGVVAAFVEQDRRRAAVTLALGAAVFLAVYLKVLQPALAGGPPTYGSFWSDFGPTPATALVGMLRRPLDTLARLLRSGLWSMFLPLAFLPWRSTRAAAGMAPTVFLLGTATYEQMHAWQTYYPLPVVAFALFGVLEVTARWRGGWRESLAVVVLFALPLFNQGYAKVLPCAVEDLKWLPQVRTALATAPRVCAQTVLFPHLDYPEHLEPLFDGCNDPAGSVTVVNLELDPYPYSREELTALVEAWKRSKHLRTLGNYLILTN